MFSCYVSIHHFFWSNKSFSWNLCASLFLGSRNTFKNPKSVWNMMPKHAMTSACLKLKVNLWNCDWWCLAGKWFLKFFKNILNVIQKSSPGKSSAPKHTSKHRSHITFSRNLEEKHKKLIKLQHKTLKKMLMAATFWRTAYNTTAQHREHIKKKKKIIWSYFSSFCK